MKKVGAIDPEIKAEIDWLHGLIEVYRQRVGVVDIYKDRYWYNRINELAKRI